MNTRHVIAETTLGPLTLVACDDAVTGVYFPGHWHLPPKRPSVTASTSRPMRCSPRRLPS